MIRDTVPAPFEIWLFLEKHRDFTYEDVRKMNNWFHCLGYILDVDVSVHKTHIQQEAAEKGGPAINGTNGWM